MTKQRSFRRDERGIAMVQTAIFLTALTALVTVGVDVGRLAFTATEVQNLADIAATAAAKHVVNGDGTSRQGADLLAGQNFVDGAAATPSNVPLVEDGTYDFATGTFNPGGSPATAVRATAAATVQNIFAGILGTPNTTVTKTATASYAYPGGGQAGLPIAIGDCAFPDPNCQSDSCLPQVLQIPSPSDNSAWTGFTEGSSTNNIGDFFPTACGGNGDPIPGIVANQGGTCVDDGINDCISLNNGQEVPLLNLIQGCLDAGLDTFLVPVIDCDAGLNGNAPVMGFATIQITSVVNSGGTKHIELRAIHNANAPGPPGGGNFGSGSVVLVN